MRIFSTRTLLSVFLFSAAVVQAQDFEDQLDVPYTRLNWASETQTSVLANRRAIFLDPLRYQGTTSSDTLKPMQWEVLYGQFRMSAADPTNFPNPSSLKAVVQAQRENGRLPIALLWQPFDFVPEKAVDDGRVLIEDVQPIRKLYRPTATNLQGQLVYTMPPPYEQAAFKPARKRRLSFPLG